MFWVIQENLYNEYGYEALLEAVQRLKVPHKIVKVVPFSDKFLPEGFDSHGYMGDINDIPEPEIDNSGLVMCMGALTLAKIAKKRGWHPGSFNNDNFNTVVCNSMWLDNMLNYDAIHTTAGNLKKVHVEDWDEFFIRPAEDTKLFSGMVLNWDRWDDYRRMSGLEDSKDLIEVAPLKRIYAEYRFFVVDGEIATYSQYKMGKSVVYNPLVEPMVIDFAKGMIAMWQPSRAFVIDIANTPNGYKIVEINCFNSAGFYACDVSKIIQAVEAMEF